MRFRVEGKMAKTVVIVGALDTKGKEFAFVKALIEKEGLKTLVVDFGVMGKPDFEPDVKREKVAQAGGGDKPEPRLLALIPEIKACYTTRAVQC